MPENPQIIQPGFSSDGGFHHLQRVCTAAGRGKQLQEACQLFCSNRSQLGADLECSSLPGILLPKQTTPCLVSHGSLLYWAALLAGTHFRLCLWFMNDIPITSAMFPVLCLVLGLWEAWSHLREDAVSAVQIVMLTSPFLHHFMVTPALPCCFLTNHGNVGSSSITGQICPSGCVTSLLMLCSCHSLFCTNHNKELQVAPNCTWAVKPFRQIFLLDSCLVSQTFSWSSNSEHKLEDPTENSSSQWGSGFLFCVEGKMSEQDQLSLLQQWSPSLLYNLFFGLDSVPTSLQDGQEYPSWHTQHAPTLFNWAMSRNNLHVSWIIHIYLFYSVCTLCIWNPPRMREVMGGTKSCLCCFPWYNDFPITSCGLL